MATIFSSIAYMHLSIRHLQSQKSPQPRIRNPWTITLFCNRRGVLQLAFKVLLSVTILNVLIDSHSTSFHMTLIWNGGCNNLEVEVNNLNKRDPTGIVTKM